jgi:hypothetical protein
MDTLPLYTFTESEDPAAIPVPFYIRQNAYRTDTYSLDLVLKSQKLHVPHAHQMSDVLSFSCEPHSYLLGAHPQARRFVQVPQDTLLLCAGVREALLVRLTSTTKAGYCAPIYRILDPATTAPLAFTCADDINKITDALAAGHTLEPFYTLYRHIEIIGRIKDASDWRRVMQMASFGECQNYVKPAHF